MTGSKISTSSTKFVLIGPIWKQDGRPGLWLAVRFSTSFSEATEWNSTKLERKQDLYVLYKVCDFQADRKDKMATRSLIGWALLDFPSETAEWNSTKFIRSKISTCSTTFVLFRPIAGTREPPWPLIGWDIFDFSSETAEWNSTTFDRKQDLNVI